MSLLLYVTYYSISQPFDLHYLSKDYPPGYISHETLEAGIQNSIDAVEKLPAFREHDEDLGMIAFRMLKFVEDSFQPGSMNEERALEELAIIQGHLATWFRDIPSRVNSHWMKLLSYVVWAGFVEKVNTFADDLKTRKSSYSSGNPRELDDMFDSDSEGSVGDDSDTVGSDTSQGSVSSQSVDLEQGRTEVRDVEIPEAVVAVHDAEGPGPVPNDEPQQQDVEVELNPMIVGPLRYLREIRRYVVTGVAILRRSIPYLAVLAFTLAIAGSVFVGWNNGNPVVEQPDIYRMLIQYRFDRLGAAMLNAGQVLRIRNFIIIYGNRLQLPVRGLVPMLQEIFRRILQVHNIRELPWRLRAVMELDNDAAFDAFVRVPQNAVALIRFLLQNGLR